MGDTRAYLAVLALVAATSLGCQPPPPARLHVCAPEQPTPWSTNWSTNAQWVLDDLAEEARLQLTRVETSNEACRAAAGKEWSGSGCYGTRGAVYCDGLTLARVGAVAALLTPVLLRWVAGEGVRPSTRAARVMMEGVERDERDRAAGIQNPQDRLPVLAGWFMAEHALDEAGMDHVIESMQAAQARPAPLINALEVRSAYRRLVMLVMGFVIGHEMAHAAGSCEHPPSDASRARLEELAAAQSKGTGVCAAQVDLDEMAADGCGLGAIEWLVRAEAPSRHEAALRQIAVDMMSVLTEFGLGDALNGVVLQLKAGGARTATLTTARVRARPRYLYPQARLALFASALWGSDARLCGETGWAFASLALGSTRECTPKPALTANTPWLRFVSPPIEEFLQNPATSRAIYENGHLNPFLLRDIDVACPALP